jgi:Glycosyl transferases group 1
VATSDLSWLIAGTILRRGLPLVSRPFRLGVVERLEYFYAMVDCIVNPMIGGTGLKIKTIEALGYGRPIIGTVARIRKERERPRRAPACVAPPLLRVRGGCIRPVRQIGGAYLWLELSAIAPSVVTHERAFPHSSHATLQITVCHPGADPPPEIDRY